ncbi:MAG TPA: tRNA (adenosine(37)-N6)-threonylcarbamoyltransferase complex dimerization subunit type 1 TsaB [Candidatus Nanopelagicales bacterium]|nr:tRNA (adenosine(37)-N6)-threonylcarbamoyltransferase complex dimerization subunit type 1 TsaB [Candidatus Nanopelagicales bacterium]
MLLLALDTSAAAVTVALHDGVHVVAELTEPGARAHGERLAPLLAEVLELAGAAPRQLTSLAVGVGPGPFTGLRVGLVTARVMALALGIEVGGVCSLDALAWQAHNGGAVAEPFAVATDARRGEVYLAEYDADAVRQEGPRVIRPGELPERVRRGPVVGAGALANPADFVDAREPALVTGAAVATFAVGVLQAGYELSEPAPLYLRRPDATPATGRKPVLT